MFPFRSGVPRSALALLALNSKAQPHPAGWCRGAHLELIAGAAFAAAAVPATGPSPIA